MKTAVILHAREMTAVFILSPSQFSSLSLDLIHKELTSRFQLHPRVLSCSFSRPYYGTIILNQKAAPMIFNHTAACADEKNTIHCSYRSKQCPTHQKNRQKRHISFHLPFPPSDYSNYSDGK